MAIQFNLTDYGLVQQVRKLMRVDSTQWPNANIANSANHWLDFLTGHAIGADKRFQWDNTNHTKLPIGTTNLVASQADYSFLTDEQGNNIITLTRIDLLMETGGDYVKLIPIDQANIDVALDEFESGEGIPQYYDKIADNIVRLYPTPATSVTSGLKFYFQRTSDYFVLGDTTQTTGFSPLLDRGFVVACAYDGALTLGLSNLQALGVDRALEVDKVETYFSSRNQDEDRTMTLAPINFM